MRLINRPPDNSRITLWGDKCWRLYSLYFHKMENKGINMSEIIDAVRMLEISVDYALNKK